MSDYRSYSYLALFILLAVLSQILMKWQINKAGPSPLETAQVAAYVFRLLLNPWIVCAVLATFFAGVAWMLTISRLDLSHAYPFVSGLFIVMAFIGILLFDEPYSWQKVAGSVLIAAGIVMSSQS